MFVEFIYWHWIYSGIEYILSTIGGIILVLDIFCQQFEDICQSVGVCAPERNVYIFRNSTFRPKGAQTPSNLKIYANWDELMQIGVN